MHRTTSPSPPEIAQLAMALSDGGEAMPAIVFSCGMGKDSAALLARWLLEPATRPFSLDDMLVLTAMVGSEYHTTVRLMETHLLPLMRQQGVRYVQVARQPRPPGARKVIPGYVVLDDSRNPQHLHPAGSETLHAEYLRSGTLPQVAKNNRRCSLKYKAEPMDNWIAANIAGPYRHVIGYAAEEGDQAIRDHSYSTNWRTAWHPLIEWGWDRQRCHSYLEQQFGEPWSRSCCGFCPFQFGPKKSELLARWRREPDKAVEALLLERSALAFNPRSTLWGGTTSAYQTAVRFGLHDVVATVEAALDAQPWAVYDVRRILNESKRTPGGKGNCHRSLRTHHIGARTDMNALVTAHPQGRTAIDTHGYARNWILHAATSYPTAEHFLVAAPHVAKPEEHKNFDTWWTQLTT